MAIIRFRADGRLVIMDPLHVWLKGVLTAMRSRSLGFMRDPLANPFDRLWIGDGYRLTPELARIHDITHVINCADDSACPPAMKERFLQNYTCLDAVDALNVNIFVWYPLFKQTLDKYLQDPTCKGVYIHCQAGMNRSATLAAAYVIKTYRVQFIPLMQRMIQERPCIMTNPSFQAQLVAFVKKMT